MIAGFEKVLVWSLLAAVSSDPQTGSLMKQQKRIAYHSGGWSSEIRVPAQSGEATLPGCRLLFGSSWKELGSFVGSLFNHIHKGSILMI